MRFLSGLVLSFTMMHSVMAAVTSLTYQNMDNHYLAAPDLNNDEWRWLGEKRDITLALYGDARPPITRISPTGMLTGYFPDMAYQLIRSLGLTLKIVHFDTAAQAVDALKARQVDMVFRPAGDDYASHASDITTINILPAYPVQVIRLADSQPIPAAENVKSFSPLDLLAALDVGKTHQAALPAGEAYYLIERNYATTLSIVQPLNIKMSGYDVLLNKHDDILLRAVGTALSDLQANTTGKLLAAQWDQDDMVHFIATPITFTEREKAWLAEHQTVRYAASSLNAPFVLNNQNGEFRGISADLLHLIQLKTGIRFLPIEDENTQDLSQRMAQKNLLMTAPLVWSNSRNATFLLSTPFMYSPEVLVTRKRDTNTDSAPVIKRIALIRDQDVSAWFMRTYPDVEVEYASNASLAMQWVAEGKVDATINTLFSARYVISGLYPHQLTIENILPFQDAAISFGVRRDNPELQSILNKTIAALPPAMISRIVSRWQGTPAARFETWNLYKTEFYSGAVIAGVLILTAAIWALILSRQVRRTRQAQSRLREEVLFRDKLINGPPRPVYVVDKNGQIIRSNEAFDRFFPSHDRENLHRSLYDGRNPLFTVWKACLQQLEEKGEMEELDFTIRVGEAERTLRHWMTPYVNENNEWAGLICGWQDITGYLALLDELSRAKEAAELANKSKSHFLATMSHEIRTPISAVIGLLELQNRQGKADPELIQAAYHSSQTLLALIGDILDMSKIESGHMELQPDWAAPEAVFMPVIRIIEGLARQKGLSFRWQLPDNQFEMYIDAVRLRQIVTNFAGNAVKFTQRGQISLQVELSLTAEHAAKLQIQVQDTGRGIAADALPTLFQPFVQAGTDTHQGTGLGLAISRDMVQMMAGTVTLESEPNRGTTVFTTIPVRLRPASVPVSPPIATRTLTATRPLRILIVDDHPANRLLISRQLTLLGHHVAEASNGTEGLRAWRTEQANLIFTDCSMPEMDGLAMTRIIRQEDSNIPVIGMTANAQLSERMRCLEAGMNQCLFRPITIEQIAASLEAFTHQLSSAETFLDLVNLESLQKFIPDTPHALNDFLTATFAETQQDLAEARNALLMADRPKLTRYLHRMTGTLSVIGIHSLSEKLAFIEELVSFEEEDEMLFLHLSEAEALLEKIITLYANAREEGLIN
ncbi:two-component system, NarL family, sensor histidine kinase EvgS [Candidatus Pantoea floridensis]|uniref:histidine kinase n=2 Tax=Candidatus Pantoea floridensis TaxID=1938870 RepID=A0A286DM62_9GAMM|nr:two-component system sensor histidine kinase EvgS [Enterobacteriaceae bacterium JKS000233]SOD59762.1 two-component system, NarL family, sensor histidine kinase EvgS [Pantoea floridensis]